MRGVRREDGQSLVFVIVAMTSFVLLMALVVDVGLWLQTQRKVQSVADAAALAGVQSLPFNQPQADADARAYAQLNSRDAAIDSVDFPSGDTISVQASERVTGFFSSLAGITSVTAKAHAAARTGPAELLSNADLQKAGSTVITPLVVNESAADCLPGCLGIDVTLRFDDADHRGSELGVMCPGGCGSTGASRNRLRGWINCSPCLPGSFGPAGGTVDVAAAPAGATNGGQVRGALQRRVGTTVILPVFDDANSASYHLAAFAAFVLDDVSWRNDSPSCRPDCKVVTGRFITYRAPGALASTDTGAPDYGVSVVGLTT
ncbi:MAG TPA: Tad domain-containing protein [Gaiellaceae bacterium]|nr:Tad domain-containing protein [Gaiellaceae bacterium]